MSQRIAQINIPPTTTASNNIASSTATSRKLNVSLFGNKKLDRNDAIGFFIFLGFLALIVLSIFIKIKLGVPPNRSMCLKTSEHDQSGDWKCKKRAVNDPKSWLAHM